MEVISRANIYRKIELAKEFLKNVTSCEDTVAVLDNVQSALEKEKVYYLLDSDSGKCIEIKKCKCGGELEFQYNVNSPFDNNVVVIMGCNKCGRGFRAFKKDKFIDAIEKWNTMNAEEEVEHE